MKTQKNKVSKVSRDIEEALAIEIAFRKELGRVNPYICVIDIAASELVNNSQKSEIEALSKKYGHARLDVEHLDMQKINQFIHLSHLAFINSRSDAFCDDVIEFLIALSSFPKGLSNKARGDKLRKTIAVLHASKNSNVELVKNLDEEIIKNYTGSVELEVVDYYRNIRNKEFHGGLDKVSENDSRLSGFDPESIKQKYKYKPNEPTKLNIKDVILYSRVWQDLAKEIRNNLVGILLDLVGIDLIVSKLCNRYKTYNHQRRDNAITQTLRLDYLQSETDIDRLRKETRGWVA